MMKLKKKTCNYNFDSSNLRLLLTQQRSYLLNYNFPKKFFFDIMPLSLHKPKPFILMSVAMNDDSINWQTKMFYYRKFRNSTSIWNKLYFCEIFFILVDIILKQIFISLINCLLGLRWLIWWNLKHVVLSEG